MAASKISDLAALTAPAVADLLVFVDVSDTTQGAGGTTKKTTLTQLTSVLPGGGLAVGDAISGGTNGCVVYQEAGDVAQSGEFTYASGVLTVRAASGQLSLQNAGGGQGGTIGRHPSNGGLMFEAATGTPLTFRAASGVEIYPTDAGATTVIRAITATGIAVTVLAAASQSANLTEWQSSAAVVHATVSENGYFTTRKTAAPADGELVAGELAFWFDSTDGAAKLMIKAKQANGTVRTGQLALT